MGVMGILMLATAGIRAQRPDTLFVSQPIPDSIFQRMQGRSFPKSCTIGRNELRYLRLSYCDRDGKTQQGEMVCNKAIANALIDIFRQLYLAKYPIERMQLIDDYYADDQRSMTANNTSCFNFRFVSGTHTISKHGMGMAVDINPLYNPYVVNGRVEPIGGKKWAYNRERRKDIPMKIDHNDLCYKLFRKHGFRWGGDWKSRKDYQHFVR